MKMREHSGIVSKRDYFLVDPAGIVVDPTYNIRNLTTPKAVAALEDLILNIIANGVKQPLVCRMVGDDLILVQGHRRLAAALEARRRGHEIRTVKVIQEAATTDEVERTYDLYASNSGGEALEPLEKAEIVRQLLAHGETRERIAFRFGLSSTQPVADLETLLASPAAIKRLVREGKVSATNAARTVRSQGAKAERVITEAASGGHATEKSIKAVTGRIHLTGKQQARAVELLNRAVAGWDDDVSSKVADFLEEISR